jgi:hypothetical protein
MRRGIGAVIGLVVIGGSLAGIGSNAPPAEAAGVSNEKGLLGIRLLQSYHDVYKKFGQPDRVYRTDQSVEMVDALDAQGNPTGAIIGLDLNAVQTAGANGRGANPYGRPGGLPGMQGMPGMPGAMPGMGGPGGYRGMNGQPGLPGMPGAMPGMGGPGGYRGMNGQPGLPGMPGAMPGGMPFPGANPANGIGTRRAGMAGTYGGQGEETFQDAGGFIWGYLNAKQKVAYLFAFNRDGRIEMIIECGRQGGGKTSRGLALGQPVSAVYATYGWPDSTDQYGRYFSLFYGPSHHVQVIVINNRVVGIDVMLREDQKFYRQDLGSPNNTAFGGRGPMTGRNAGAPFGGMPYGAPGGYGGRGGGRKEEE